MPKYLRIAVVGPESSGKTSLCNALGTKYNATVVAEYARDYLQSRVAWEYTPDDAFAIAQGQMARERTVSRRESGMVISDTEAITSLIWSEYICTAVNVDLDHFIRLNYHDLYIVCDFKDVPWRSDGLRNYETSRPWFFERLNVELADRRLRHAVVSGDLHQRIDMVYRFLLQFNFRCDSLA